MGRKIRLFFFVSGLLLIIVVSQPGIAGSKTRGGENSLFLQTSLLTHHWRSSSNTNNFQQLKGVEYHFDNGPLYGAAFFKNSYSQPCWYLYRGNVYPLKEGSTFQLYGKLTYGVITGYDDEGGRYEAYLNRMGTFPALIPSIGLGYKNFSLETSFFADAGFIINIGIKF